MTDERTPEALLEEAHNGELCSNPQCPEAGRCGGECVRNFIPTETAPELSIEAFLILRIEELRAKLQDLPAELWLILNNQLKAQHAIIDWHKNWPVLIQGPLEVDDLLRILAQQFYTHPDWNPEWAVVETEGDNADATKSLEP